eukprot:5365025-Amphidinium_carterae.1
MGLQVHGTRVIIGQPMMPLGFHAHKRAHGIPEYEPCREPAHRDHVVVPDCLDRGVGHGHRG